MPPELLYPGTRPVIGLDFREQRCTRPRLLDARNRFAGCGDYSIGETHRINPVALPHGVMCGGYWSRTSEGTFGVWGWRFALD